MAVFSDIPAHISCKHGECLIILRISDRAKEGQRTFLTTRKRTGEAETTHTANRSVCLCRVSHGFTGTVRPSQAKFVRSLLTETDPDWNTWQQRTPREYATYDIMFTIRRHRDGWLISFLESLLRERTRFTLARGFGQRQALYSVPHPGR